MISFGIEAEAPILKLFLERSVCAPSIYQLELALHMVSFSILNFILLLICMCYFNN
jgi:hypothetical protein